jgi:predicted lipid-binding transport protein (Tim44 family)
MSSGKAPLWRILRISAIAGLVALAPAVADAKMGDLFKGGAGSRGSRTYSAPPTTNTAPTQAAPIQRSVVPPPAAPQQQQPGLGAPRPGFGAPGGFGRSFMGGLAGGLLGAGLFGLLTGHGFLGGIGGFASFIGLLFQIALLAFLARMAFVWWQSRNAAPAGLGARPGPRMSMFEGGLGAGGGAARQGPRPEPLQLSAADFPAFERLLAQMQDAYSREDTGALSRLATPEMLGYFNEELAERRQQGVVNRISGVKLLQGDLAEAWREGVDEYATVAMRFALIDVIEDRATGRVVSGDPAQPTQATQVWTFRRPAGAAPEAWRLSALQEAA